MSTASPRDAPPELKRSVMETPLSVSAALVTRLHGLRAVQLGSGVRSALPEFIIENGRISVDELLVEMLRHQSGWVLRSQNYGEFSLDLLNYPNDTNHP